jgi:hypothetical protein
MPWICEVSQLSDKRPRYRADACSTQMFSNITGLIGCASSTSCLSYPWPIQIWIGSSRTKY